MDRRSASASARPARRFSFSWADEVEREESRQQQQREEEEEAENRPPPPRGGETKAKANPFGAARPREVVLAEKGVDWRARYRELDDLSRSRRGRSCAAAGKRHAGAAAPVPASRLEDSAPASRRKISARPVSYGSAWGGKRNCGGQGELPRQVRSVADHGRRVFGQLNIGEEGVELEQANLQNRVSVCAHRIGAKPETVDDKITHSTLPVPAGTEDGGCVAGRRRRRRRSRRNMGSN